MFTYRLHLEDGSDAGEAVYAQMIRPGDERSTSEPASGSASPTLSRSTRRWSRGSWDCSRSRRCS